MDYKNAGVDIEAGYRSVELMKKYVNETVRPEVLGGLGGFSGAFSLAAMKDMEKPTLVSGTDGVGTKLKLAFLMDTNKRRTIFSCSPLLSYTNLSYTLLWIIFFFVVIIDVVKDMLLTLAFIRFYPLHTLFLSLNTIVIYTIIF